jgi:hypothetical protein
MSELECVNLTTDLSLLGKAISLLDKPLRIPRLDRGIDYFGIARLVAAISTIATALSRSCYSTPLHPEFRLRPDWLR